MSVTSADLDAAVASAAAVVRSLPAAGLVPGAPLEGQAGLASALPAPESQAVSASLTGAVSGTIVLICHPELAAAIENGPIGPQTLVAGLETAMADATAALAGSLGAVQYVSALALDADVALANAAGAERVAVVTIASDGTPVASVVLLLDAAAPALAEPAADAAQFESLSQSLVGGAGSRAVELLNDVEMGVTAELGRTRMTVKELLSMQPGSIVELDRAAGSPVDLLVNGTLVARGEVVVIDEEFGVRITEIIGYDQKGEGK